MRHFADKNAEDEIDETDEARKGLKMALDQKQGQT